MAIDPDDPKMEGYVPLQTYRDLDMGASSRRIREDSKYGPLTQFEVEEMLNGIFSSEVTQHISDENTSKKGLDNAKLMTALQTRLALSEPVDLMPVVPTPGYYDPGNPGVGWFSDYLPKGAIHFHMVQQDDQTGKNGGGIRDLLFMHHVDRDTRDYSAIGQKVSYGGRSLMTGAWSTPLSKFLTQYKDLVGWDAHASGAVDGPYRGVSGLTVGARNEGSGILSNEGAVENPASGKQSVSMAGWQAIMKPFKGAEDAGHVYRGFLVSNLGHRITAGLQIQTAPEAGYTGEYRYGIDMTLATITENAIRLRGTGPGATVIEFDANDYMLFDRANNRWAFVPGGVASVYITGSGLSFSGNPGNSVIEFSPSNYFAYDKTNNRLNALINNVVKTSLSAAGLGVGTGAIGYLGAHLIAAPADTAGGSIRILSGGAPGMFYDGLIWNQGGSLKYREGTVTKTFAFVEDLP